jgi:hypothetical protein
MTRLRLDLIVRTYNVPAGGGNLLPADRWTWRLWAGTRIVATSGSQLYTRRIDCARGAEVGAGLIDVVQAVQNGGATIAARPSFAERDDCPVRIIDERGKP